MNDNYLTRTRYVVKRIITISSLLHLHREIFFFFISRRNIFKSILFQIARAMYHRHRGSKHVRCALVTMRIYRARIADCS